MEKVDILDMTVRFLKASCPDQRQKGNLLIMLT